MRRKEGEWRSRWKEVGRKRRKEKMRGEKGEHTEFRSPQLLGWGCEVSETQRWNGHPKGPQVEKAGTEQVGS